MIKFNHITRSRRRGKDDDHALGELFLAALGHRITILGVNNHGWSVYPKEPPPPGTAEFLAQHHDRLRALMDRLAVLLGLDWEDGEAEVLVTVVDGGRGEEFDTFRLPWSRS
jgi:hypothetical protein